MTNETGIQKEMTMQTAGTTSRSRLWTSRILQGLSGIFLVMDGGMKVWKPRFVVEATTQLGYPEAAIAGTGAVLLFCTALYLIPRTAVLGAMLLTAYLGGAVAINVRAATPAFNIVFPILSAIVIWAALVLRDQRLEKVIFKGN